MAEVIQLAAFKLSDEDMKKAEATFIDAKTKLSTVFIENGCPTSYADDMLGVWEDHDMERKKAWLKMKTLDIDTLRASIKISDEPPDDFDPDTTIVFDL